MDFNQVPQEKKTQFALLIGQMGKSILAILFGVLILGSLWGVSSSVPEPPNFGPQLEEVPDVPWDYVLFKDVDFLQPPTTEQVAYGRRLVDATADYIGPNTDKPFAGNNLNCSSCHLDGGGKPFAAPFVTVPSQFPQFRSRENKEGTIEERVNGCMQRSMNGKPLPVDGEEMTAIVAYMDWLSYDKPRGEKIKGNKFLSVQFPDRRVDLENGKAVYIQHCQSCHMDDGQGQRALNSFTYTYPPLWGPDSYNDGAGMHRVITAAQFIKGNMPLGTTADEPLLTDEEAYDVAGYINSFARPAKANKMADFPDRTLKPMSTSYGPWADSFSADQHKFGPYGEIAAFYKAEYGLNKSK